MRRWRIHGDNIVSFPPRPPLISFFFFFNKYFRIGLTLGVEVEED